VEFAREGPARYLSHLDTARALQRTFARAGLELDLTCGMRPKPRLAVGLPLPVGAVGLSELAVADVRCADGRSSSSQALDALRAAVPPGLRVLAFEATERHLRLRPRLAIYEWRVDVAAAALAAAAARYASAATVPWVRRSPKGERRLDLRRYVDEVAVDPVGEDPCQCASVRFAVSILADGAARPAEVLAQLLAWSSDERLQGLGRLVMPVAPDVQEADERADAAGTGQIGADADGHPARVVTAALIRLGVVYDGLATRGPAREWLERHATEKKT
jgi:radical SAM-linked protein